jgi:hypothetical protein
VVEVEAVHLAKVIQAAQVLIITTMVAVVAAKLLADNLQHPLMVAMAVTHKCGAMVYTMLVAVVAEL